MSDFVSSFWSLWVIVLTVASIAGCAILLVATGRIKVTGKAGPKDAGGNKAEVTGHVWDDDLKEYNNPLPKWWSNLFWITLVFAIAYLVLYPGLGTLPGVLGWTSTGQYQRERADADARLKPLLDRFAAMPIEQIAKDPEGHAMGERLFLNNCAQCHGSDARGSKGFPNLTDGDWLYGGTPATIEETITKGRTGVMPPMAAAVGTPDDVKNVANYVLSLSGSPHDSTRAALGKAKFGACAACHGMDGKGNPAMGAPNLTDNVWLHGFGEKAIIDIVNNGKTNVMPPQADKLTAEQVKVLTAYVWGKGGGVKAAPAPAAGGDEAASVAVENGTVIFYFASGKADLATGADKALADVVAGVKDGKKAVVSGYVDSSGNAAQNAELAKQRAVAVRDQLKALGVAEDKVELQKPADVEAGKGAQARRVEVKLV